METKHSKVQISKDKEKFLNYQKMAKKKKSDSKVYIESKRLTLANMIWKKMIIERKIW